LAAEFVRQAFRRVEHKLRIIEVVEGNTIRLVEAGKSANAAAVFVAAHARRRVGGAQAGVARFFGCKKKKKKGQTTAEHRILHLHCDIFGLLCSSFRLHAEQSDSGAIADGGATAGR